MKNTSCTENVTVTRWNRELTLKCKLKCYVKPMKDPLGVSPSKGNQGTTRGKEKNYFDLGGNRTHDLRIRSIVTLLTELRGRTEKVGDDTLHSGRGYFSNFLCESDTAYSQKKNVQLLKG